MASSGGVIDLRSDTVTRPSADMRRAMAEAVVGDDVWGDDPTVNELQRVAAEITGKQAALFVPSGTMANLLAILAHCERRGSEVLVGDQSHIYHYEGGGASAVGGVAFHPIPTTADGHLPIEALDAACRDRPDDPHCPRPALLCIENTHNRCGGAVLPLDYMRLVGAWARARGLPLHMDGARVFNAAAALGVPVKAVVAEADTVSFCLSKGLGCPVGSLLCGPANVIARAHRLRKMLGGGMRQAGVLAAPGLLALRSHPEKMLSRDHLLAAMLAQGLAALPGVVLDPASVQSNIVVFRMERVPPGSSSGGSSSGDAANGSSGGYGQAPAATQAAAAGGGGATAAAAVSPAAALVAAMQQRNVLVSCFRDGVRAVTHCDLQHGDVERALEVARAVLAPRRS